MLCTHCRVYRGVPVCPSCQTYFRLGSLLQGGKLSAYQEVPVLSALRNCAGALADLAEGEVSGPFGPQSGGRAAGQGDPETGAFPENKEAKEKREEASSSKPGAETLKEGKTTKETETKKAKKKDRKPKRKTPSREIERRRKAQKVDEESEEERLRKAEEREHEKRGAERKSKAKKPSSESEEETREDTRREGPRGRRETESEEEEERRDRDIEVRGKAGRIIPAAPRPKGHHRPAEPREPPPGHFRTGESRHHDGVRRATPRWKGYKHAKIEDSEPHFIGWTSSVFVAFALPDLYFIVPWPWPPGKSRGKTVENRAKHGKISENLGKHGKTSENLGKHGKTVENLGKHGKTLENSWRNGIKDLGLWTCGYCFSVESQLQAHSVELLQCMFDWGLLKLHERARSSMARTSTTCRKANHKKPTPEQRQQSKVSEMFKHFSLLRTGVSILLIFFGCVLLLRNQVSPALLLSSSSGLQFGFLDSAHLCLSRQLLPQDLPPAAQQ
eukprot:Skav232170  [mRNA]  locus=scaffold4749:20716:30794:- [translate_table: standard]